MNRIKELRKQRKITQKALADIFGVSVRTIQKWEHGDTAIKAVKTKKLADYFEVSEGYLLGYSQSPDIQEEKGLQLSKCQQYLLKLISIKASLLREQEEISAQDLSNIKKQARCLYEDLVWMQFEAEEREGK
nr:MAG TPA: helix-turn-helix domain protein [Caudoviricetes sp.]DAW54504.1 MAG TPA: helix-turn-helix domain protein [Caudoviricetes sp.]